MSVTKLHGDSDAVAVNAHRSTWFVPERPIDGGTVFRAHAAERSADDAAAPEIPVPSARSN